MFSPFCCQSVPVTTVVPGPQGLQGPAGASGATGPTGATGSPGLRWKGAWNSSTAYAANDAVSYSNQDWICLNANTNIAPSISTDIYWSLLVNGSTGAQGPSGVEAMEVAYGNDGGTPWYNTDANTWGLINLATTTPVVTLPSAGTYIVFARVGLIPNASSAYSIRIYDTVAEAAVPNTTRFINTEYYTLDQTIGPFEMILPVISYTVAATTTLELQGYFNLEDYPKITSADIVALLVNP